MHFGKLAILASVLVFAAATGAQAQAKKNSGGKPTRAQCHAKVSATPGMMVNGQMSRAGGAAVARCMRGEAI